MEKIVPGLAQQMAYKMFFSPVRFKRPMREESVRTMATKFTHRINGKETAFYSWGLSENPLIVLVHGWMGRATQFHALIEALIKENFRVMAFDGPAHGESHGKSTDLREFATALDHIQSTYGPINLAIGHSFGGVAVLFAIENGLRLNNVVMIASPTIGDDIVKQFVTQMNGTAATGEAFKQAIRRKFGFEFDELSASHIIKRIKLNSLLLVHDNNDSDVPISHAELLANLFPPAETLFTTDLGHTRILRDRDTIAQILNFINKVLSGRQKKTDDKIIHATP
jgi:pimeloyl-ACP methyl ester carboxylesterase